MDMSKGTPHVALTLRGNQVDEGIVISKGQVPFTPHSGMTRENSGLLASTVAPDGKLEKVYVAIVKESVVLAPCEEVPQKELVLVQQYSPGTGSKRWPSFYVEFGPEVRVLSQASTSGGSGGETWVLVSAPLGWAANIASQFIDERDYPSQTISFKPELNEPGKKEEEQESDIPIELVIAFGGNEEKAKQFMAKVANLPANRLDEHIVTGCGRNRVKAHLEEISGDPNFFLGADPNRVVSYVAATHLE
jgi:hypothetical protein